MTQPQEEQVITAEQLVEALVARRPQYKPHEHQWAVLNVDYPPEPSNPVHPRMAAPSYAYPVTFVAIQCSCGLLQSVVMEGYWTMVQLTMKIGEANATSQARSTQGTPGDQGHQ